jgi:hypothetical protein
MRLDCVLRALILAVALGFSAATTVTAADAEAVVSAVESIQLKQLKQHVSVLASDTFEGREAGTRGGKAAGAYLIDTLKKLKATPGGSSSYYQFFGADYRNVLVLMPGSDPELKDEYVVVSSHYDHVGFGSSRNSYGPIGRIHNGADDNASGTAGLLELIQAFGTLKPAPRRSILFAFWDAEEKGLLGSEHWVSHPTIPLKQVKLMFNVDMIGRLRDNSLEMYGTRTAAGLRRLVSEQNDSSDLTLDFNWNTKRESDHYPFYARRIPYLMFHTRKHENYHRPSDDVDKLNLEGMQSIVRLMFRTIHSAAEAAELPAFRSAALTESSGTQLLQRRRRRRSKPARLGIGWDQKLAADGTIKINKVVSGSPAQQAGLKVGDEILKFGNHDLNPAEEFSLVVLAAESPVQVTLRRESEPEPVEVEVALNGKPQRIGISFTDDEAEPGVVRLLNVTPGSAAARAGLKRNHRIYLVDDQPFKTKNDFYDLITTAPNPVKLLVEGSGRVAEVNLKLLESPPEQSNEQAAAGAE